MSTPKTIVAAALTAAVLIAGPAGAVPRSGEVLVTNGADQPVPVAGSVTLEGTPAVTLAGATPLAVTPTPPAAGDLVNVPILKILPEGEVTDSVVLFTVPEGKTFQAEHISMATLLRGGVHPLVQVDFRSPQLGRTFIPFTEQGSLGASGLTDWVASEPLTAYASEGTDVKLFFSRRQDGEGQATLDGVLAGRLVDVR